MWVYYLAPNRARFIEAPWGKEGIMTDETKTAAACGATTCILCRAKHKNKDPSFRSPPPRLFPSPCTMIKGHRGHCWPGARKALGGVES